MRKDSRKGAALLYVVVLLALVSIFAGGALILSKHNMNMTASESSAEQAYFTAKSGLNSTVEAIKTNSEDAVKIAESMTVGTVRNLSVSREGGSSINESKYGSLNITLTCKKMHEERTGVCGIIQVDSTGTFNNISRTVSATVEVTFSEGLINPIAVFDNFSANSERLTNISFSEIGEDSVVQNKSSLKELNERFKISKPSNMDEQMETLDDFLNEIAKTQMSNLKLCSNKISSSCKYISVWAGEWITDDTVLEIDNSKGDIVIYFKPIAFSKWGYGNNLGFNIKNTKNMVYIVFEGYSSITFKEKFNISYTNGQSVPEVSNVAIINLDEAPISFVNNITNVDKKTVINAWVINPLSSVEVNTKKQEININGGIIANSVTIAPTNGQRPNNITINGLIPSDSLKDIFSIISEVSDEGAKGKSSWKESYGAYE